MDAAGSGSFGEDLLDRDAELKLIDGRLECAVGGVGGVLAIEGLTLSAAGRRFLRAARHSVSLVAVGTFTPTGGTPVKQSRRLTLRRGLVHKG